MHLLPSNGTVTQAEEALVSRTGREQRLRVALDKVADDYDLVVIDCPPTLGVLTVGALSASQKVVIPLQAETLSHRGVLQLLDTVHDVKQFINSELEVAGVLHSHGADVKAVRWHPTTELLASASYDDTLKLYAQSDEEWRCISTLSGHTSTVWSLAFSADGAHLLLCGE